MIYLGILIFIVSVFEIRLMAKRKQNREIVIFIIISILTFSLGYYYFSHPYEKSFAQRILSILGQEF